MKSSEQRAGQAADRLAPSDTVLEIEDLCVTFNTELGRVSAVDNVSLNLHASEIVGIVGESGCGKSVTAMSLTGLLPGTARVTGSARLRGKELIGARESYLRSVRGREIAYIFQEPMNSLNPVMPVGRQIAEVLRVHEHIGRRKAVERAVELLKLVGIPSPDQRVANYPHQMSGGMRQRVMIAMAVACGPQVLVADEPTTALDVTVQAGILDVLRGLRDHLGTSILIITHDLGVIADVADRVVVMYAGRVVEQADLFDVFDAPRHHYTAGLLEASPKPGNYAGTNRLQEIPGLVPVLSVQPNACTFADRCSAADATCLSGAPPMAHQGRTTAATPHLAACWHPVRPTRAGQEVGR